MEGKEVGKREANRGRWREMGRRKESEIRKRRTG